MKRRNGRVGGARPEGLFKRIARRRADGVRAAVAKVATAAAVAVVCVHDLDHADAAQVAVTWTGGTGTWNTAAKWSPAVIPNNGADTYNVFIDGGKTGTASAVTLDDFVTIDNLTVDASDSLTLTTTLSFKQLTFAPSSGSATITNNGQINLGGTPGNPFDLVAGADVTLAGNGQLALMDVGSYFMGMDDTQTVTNGASHTISGQGVADNFRLVNNGTISANVDGGYLQFSCHGASQNSGTMNATGGGILGVGVESGGSFVNSGTMRAFTGSTLEIGGQAVDGTFTNNGTLTIDSGATLSIAFCTYNNGGKTLQATAGQTILLNYGVVDGGAVSANGAGRLVFNNGTLRNVTLIGNFLASSDTPSPALTFEGTITNNVAAGTAPETPENYYFIDFTGDTTLAGSAPFTFSGPVNADATQGRLIIPLGKVVQFDEQFNFQGRISNSGTFRNTGADQNAIISCVSYPQSSSNTGTLQVTGTGNNSTLTIQTHNPTDSLTNSGVIEASGSGNRLIIDGDYVFNVGGGVIRAVNGATLELRTGYFTNDSKFQAGSDGTTTLSIGGGAVYTISGTYQPPAGSTFELNGGVVEGGTLASGPGTLYSKGGGALHDLTVSGTLVHGSDTETFLAGTITNNSPFTFTYDPTGSSGFAVSLAQDTTLAGSGTITVQGHCITQGTLAGGVPTKLTVVSGKTLRVLSDPSVASRWFVSGVRMVNQGTLNIGADSTVQFSTADTYSQSASSAMIVDGELLVSSMPFTISAGTFTGTGTLDNELNTFTFAIPTASIGNIEGYTGNLVVNAGTTLTANRVRQHGLTVAGTLNLRPGVTFAGTSVDSLDLAGTGKLDLGDDHLIVHSAVVGSWNGSAYTGITGSIQTGRNGNATPLWDGTSGIVTSQTAATSGNFTSLGVSSASQALGIGATETSTWDGFPVTGTDTLVMYTYGGDATLDGRINIDDYIRIDQGISAGLTGWSNGDFNYDGKVNIDDYTTVIDANIGNQNGFVFPTAGGFNAVAAVPEPAGMVSLLGVLLLARRRRKAKSESHSV